MRVPRRLNNPKLRKLHIKNRYSRLQNTIPSVNFTMYVHPSTFYKYNSQFNVF